MSNVLKALEQSERSHQQLHNSAPGGASRQAVSHRADTPLWLHATCLLLPAVATVSWVGYQSYQSALVDWISSNQPQEVVVDVPAALSVKPYPDFATLAVNRRTTPLPQAEPAIRRDEPTPSTSSAPSADSELDGVDLSSLPPSLARRVEAAMSSESVRAAMRDTGEADDAAVDLSMAGDDLIGQLPAMNFQTHVYTSDANRRWVKINGQEYKQGEQIDADTQLVRIAPQSCTIRFRGKLIRVPALYDWPG
ncbi:general secretion pathway protein GspB [Vibrio proteolyticus]|uniref:Type II secretion system protein GspB C-terminal domain-containing protein n=1 Tax=Vibrio proteolyticus NBRC 13287 TaxID=1219065 RepID=U3A5I4_VIBPR|nr:general secretion pathway protein GspB [Vibrio proteolyticus]GAD68960.1 hypothetical protein VPR01S_21_00450 [Vibrio proteolyticus NBRC 13287]